MTQHAEGECPHPARFSFIASWQRPARKAVLIERKDGENTVFIHLECGHVSQCVTHFHYTLGETHPCNECGKAIASELPEFKGHYDANGTAIAAAKGE